MSLMKSLARVAAGVMLAKGVGAIMKKGSGQRSTGGGILGDLLGGQSGKSASSSGGLGDLLGQVLGGQTPRSGTGTPYGGANSPSARGYGQPKAQGGLGGLLDSLTSSAGQAAAAGGIGGLLGSLLGNNTAQAQQDQGRVLAQQGAQPQNDATFGQLFNDALANQGEPSVAPTPEQNAIAGLMLRAMIQAAKADGVVDETERQRLMSELGDIDEEERNFIRAQMAAPVDAEALARDVPKGLEAQVYTMSLLAIDFDSEDEARYLDALARAMGLDQATVNDIHGQVGVQSLYT